jgi:hypothetical protein
MRATNSGLGILDCGLRERTARHINPQTAIKNPKLAAGGSRGFPAETRLGGKSPEQPPRE